MGQGLCASPSPGRQGELTAAVARDTFELAGSIRGVGMTPNPPVRFPGAGLGSFRTLWSFQTAEKPLEEESFPLFCV